MKFFMLTFALVVLIAVVSIEANPQRVQKPYYPKPTRAPRGMRTRRQLIGGGITDTAAGGKETKMQIGTQDHNLVASSFGPYGESQKNNIPSGASLAYNNNGHGLSIGKEHIPNMRDSFIQTARLNVLDNGVHKIDANAFASQNKLANGFKYERNGFGADWNHVDGHAATANFNKFPGLGNQVDVAGKVNLFTSDDRNTRLDFNAGANKWLTGPFSDQRTNFNTGIGATHYFGSKKSCH